MRHDLMVVMTPDCDLIWDFEARFVDDEARRNLTPTNPDITTHKAAVQHILLCDAYAEADIRARLPGSDVWRRVKRNQDERYHRFPEAPIDGRDELDAAADELARLPDVYLDFKRALALPTELLYEGFRVNGVERVALVPPLYSHDLIHRFYGFLSRVAVPEW